MIQCVPQINPLLLIVSLSFSVDVMFVINAASYLGNNWALLKAQIFNFVQSSEFTGNTFSVAIVKGDAPNQFLFSGVIQKSGDLTTQLNAAVNIDALMAAGVPYSNIQWLDWAFGNIRSQARTSVSNRVIIISDFQGQNIPNLATAISDYYRQFGISDGRAIALEINSGATANANDASSRQLITLLGGSPNLKLPDQLNSISLSSVSEIVRLAYPDFISETPGPPGPPGPDPAPATLPPEINAPTLYDLGKSLTWLQL